MHRFVGWAFLINGLLLWPAVAAAQAPATASATGDSEAETPDTAASSSATAADGTSGQAATGDKGSYSVRLKDLEDRVNRLKEQIFRSKARLSLLAETVLDRRIAGANAVISFHNEMGGSFWLMKATFLLDGGPILNKTDEDGNLAERDVIEIFDGPVMPGEHTLSVVLQYRGHGFGIFSYLKGYSFKIRSSRTFTVGEGKTIKIGVVGFEKGTVTTPLEERPAVRYSESVSDFEGAATAAATSAETTDGEGAGVAEGAE